MSGEREERIAKLPLEKRALLEKSLMAHMQASSAGISIARRTIEGPAPLSFSQERLWFLAQLYPEQTNYNEARAYRFRGELDVAALQAALAGVVRRHEILRTTYQHQDTGPVQVVGEPRRVPMPIVELLGVAEAERAALAQGRFAEIIEVPYDLTSDLMLRCCLYRLDANDHILLVVRHHIASDGWSSRVFWKEVQELYTAEKAGGPANLPPLAVQYADYAAWQRQRLTGEWLESQMGYWREQLAGLPDLQIPTDRRRPETLSYRGGMERFELEPSLVAKLQTLARQETTTLHTLLMSAYALLLWRMTFQDDFSIGVPVAGRNREALEPLIGFFINTLVIRVQPGENPSFRNLLRKMHHTMMVGLDHQEVPFEKLVEDLDPERHLNRSPLFSTTFQLLNIGRVELQLPGLVVEEVEVPNLHAKFDMEVTLARGPGGMEGQWRYASDLFEPATIKRMVAHYKTLLEAIARDADCAIGQLPMLTETEREQLWRFSNAVSTSVSKVGCIHELFEEMAERRPDAPAVSLPGEELDATGQTLSYGELNSRANQLAHALRRWGVGADTLVALYLDRSLEMVIGILGILKAGGAYVPLDPANPAERLAGMLAECGAGIVLTQQALSEKAHAISAAGTKIVPLDGDLPAFAGESECNPTKTASPDSMAYVIFTSGSTGKPKGVMVTHANVVRLFRATEAWFDFNKRDVWTMFHSFAFDFSVWELWGALLYGGRVVVVPYIVSRSPDLFYRLLRREGVTVLNQTPSAFRQLIHAEESAGRDGALALRYVIFGGEALEIESLRPWFNRHGDQQPQLINMYGITETTVHVTYRRLGMEDLATTTASIIGRPIPDLQVHVLDKFGGLAGIGIAGEIYVGGAGLGRGYLNQPELTEERFFTHAGLEGARLYRAGDLARWLANGELEYLGRIDQQVKIRGFRVELGEIEAVLARHPGVREAVVLYRADQSGDKRLTAYLVPAGREAIIDTSELRAFCTERLPDYMVPAAYIAIERLPLTPNSKIDISALPVPDADARLGNQPPVAPRTAEEAAIAAIWCEVLKRDQAGIYDNFFELGGHSLLITQVAARISQSFQVEFPVRVMFEKPTIAEIAGQVKTLLENRIDQHQKLEAALSRLKRLTPEERAELLKARKAGSPHD